MCIRDRRHTAPHNVDFSLLASSLDGETPSEFDLGLSKRKALFKMCIRDRFKHGQSCCAAFMPGF